MLRRESFQCYLCFISFHKSQESIIHRKILPDFMSLTSLAVIKEKESDVGKALTAMNAAVFKNGALSIKNKALIALALGCALKCDTCIETNWRLAMDNGATKEEVRETLIVAMYMAGPSSVVWTPVIDEILAK